MEKKKVLVVDDEPHILKLVEYTLSKSGFEVITGFVGQEALKRAESDQPDLILLDVMMPNMDGFETAKILKENQETKHIPIVFLSAKTRFEDEWKGFESGAVDYIKKPFEPQHLVEKVNEHIL
ncbi:PleD family two-component system response regulator [Nanoarchaeota archaeon]